MLCNAPLSLSFADGGLLQLGPYVLGLVGIFGWGAAIERLLAPRAEGASLAHAFLQGTVVVALLLFGGTLAGLPVASWLASGVAWLGVAMAVALLPGLMRRRRPAGTSALPVWVMAPVVVAAAIGALDLASRPMVPGDLTAIWAFHAKALTCEALFDSRYVLEPVWAGTHPDYPLFLPLLDAFFFALADSFRDDWVKVWRAVAFLVMTISVVRSVARVTGRRAPPALVGAALIAFVTLPQTTMLDGIVDLNVMAFSALAAAAVLEGQSVRLPLYLFALVFTKHEGMVQAFSLVGLLGLTALVAERRRGLAASALTLRWVAPWLLLTAVWLAVLGRLPSLHENYPARILSLDAWREGLAAAPVVLRGYVEVLSHQVFAMTLGLGAAGLALVALRRREFAAVQRPAVLLAAFFGMLVVFFLIYLVSPFGPELYKITLARLFSQVAPLALLAFAALPLATSARSRRTQGVLLAAGVAVFGVYAAQKSGKRAFERAEAVRTGRFGLDAYRADPAWQQAFAVDAIVPPGARGALLGEERYFEWTFRLYPRLLYPAPPETLAGTWRPWVPWTVVAPDEVKRLQIAFIVENGVARLVSDL